MKRVCTFFIILIALSCWTSVADAQRIRMPDANLAALVRDALGLAPGAPITRQAMQRLTFLDAQRSGIREVTGLEHATQLEALDLFDNEIRDIRFGGWYDRDNALKHRDGFVFGITAFTEKGCRGYRFTFQPVKEVAAEFTNNYNRVDIDAVSDQPLTDSNILICISSRWDNTNSPPG